MEIELAVLVGLIALSAAFSAAEAALLITSRIRVKYLLKKNPKSGEVHSLARLKANPPKMIMTILIGNNVANISASFIAAHITGEYFGDYYLGIATGIMAFVILVFAEIVPKNYATANSDRIALLASGPIEVLSIALSPLIYVLGKISSIVPGTYIYGRKRVHFSEDELRSVLEVGVEDRAISNDEKIIFERVLDFNDTYAKEIMTPKAGVNAMKAGDRRADALKKIARYKKSRYPVLDEAGRPVGIVSLREVMQAPGDATMSEIMAPPYFASGEMVAHELFVEMQKKHKHMAIVLNSYGAMEGIVTIEDLVEEIVGEIEEESAYVQKEEGKKGALVVFGDARLHDVEKELGLHFPDSERFGSVGAFLHYQLKRLPVRGDVVIALNCRMKVVEVGENFGRLRVRINRPDSGKTGVKKG
ncbi:MAG: hemolysin family protein [Candidatus Micrarchaeota archaeon]